MKKKNGILINLLLKVAKSLPLALLVAAVFAMAAYVLCVSFLPLGYCAEGEFVMTVPGRSPAASAEAFTSDDFYSRVAADYSTASASVSTDTLKKLIFLDVDGASGVMTLSVRTGDPGSSYAIMKSYLSVAETVTAEMGGSFELLSEGSIPTSRTRVDFGHYIVMAAVIGAVLVILFAIIGGLTLTSIGSEKEFTRIMDVDLLGSLPYSPEPITRHKLQKTKSE